MLKLYFVECVYIVSDPAACLDVTEKEHEYKRTEVFDVCEVKRFRAAIWNCAC